MSLVCFFASFRTSLGIIMVKKRKVVALLELCCCCLCFSSSSRYHRLVCDCSISWPYPYSLAVLSPGTFGNLPQAGRPRVAI